MAGYLGNPIVARLGTEKPRRVAEIGVYEGVSSGWLLARMPLLTLYMVDQWKVYHDSNQPDASHDGGKWDRLRKLAHARTEFAADRRIVLQGDSVEMADAVPDNSLDMAFIDANHTLEGVRRDMEAWWPKVKPGGWFAGHDWEPKEPRIYGVVQAVEEFGERMNMRHELGEDATWFFRRTMECGRCGVDSVRDYAKLIASGKHFAQANYGDGEWSAILGKTGMNVNGETYAPILGAGLRETLKNPDGMWAGTNPGKVLREEAEDYAARLETPPAWRNKEILSDANVAGKLGGFLGACRKRRVIVVGPSQLSQLPKKVLGTVQHVLVPDAVAWGVVDRTCAEVRKRAQDGDVVLFASGMASNLAIHRLWPEYRDRVTLLDVGAILDPYVGVLSRSGYRTAAFQEALQRNLEGA